MRNFLNFAILGVLLYLLHHTSIECSFEEARVRKFKFAIQAWGQ